MELLTSQLWDLETTGVFDAGGGQLVAGFEREQQASAAAEWLRASRPVNSAGGILFVSVEPAPTADQLAVNADAETVTISTGTDAGTGTTGAERRVDVTIRAGGTFGHGGHQTTKLAAELLLERLTPGQRVLDIGTGSGILAIAAAKAGASHVVGMDNDPLAVTVATENGLANNVAADFGSWTVAEAAAVLGGPANLLVINVLLPVHRELATQVLGAMTLESSSSSVLVTTGYLDEQAEEVVSLYAGKLSVITERRRDQWSAHVFAVRD